FSARIQAYIGGLRNSIPARRSTSGQRVRCLVNSDGLGRQPALVAALLDLEQAALDGDAYGLFEVLLAHHVEAEAVELRNRDPLVGSDESDQLCNMLGLVDYANALEDLNHRVFCGLEDLVGRFEIVAFNKKLVTLRCTKDHCELMEVRLLACK